MIRPKSAPIYDPVDLKLGIKSSLPSVKSTLALLFLMWKEMGHPAELEYSVPQGSGIALKPDIREALYTKVHNMANSVTEDTFDEVIGSNLMLKAQLEALIVAFELIWRVAKIRFSDGRSNSSERKGGARYPKKLWYTANMDLLNAICGDDANYDYVLYSWLGFDLPQNTQAENKLIQFLTVISESAYFKLDDNNSDVVFNLESIYDAVLSANEAVDISGDKEAKGSLRILKSALDEGLFASLSMKGNTVTSSDTFDLTDYAARVRVSHQLNPKMYQIMPDDASTEDDDETLTDDSRAVNFLTGLQTDFPLNRILFGAPGTGKSFTINNDRKTLLGKTNEADYERVTFHPDYSYANFVGTYKPVPCKDDDGKSAITYKYVPGPFMRVYVKALKNAMSESPRPFLLVIEEINRAEVAAVFGDIFQLLDRGDNGVSEYPIQASEDIKAYLAESLEPGFKDADNETREAMLQKYDKIRIPDNMFIWATMNSADQGVFPMDTAFKRRWDFTYLGIDDNDTELQGKYVVMGSTNMQRVEWNTLRKAINEYLADQKINEDKQLGPYFIPRRIVVPADGGENIDSDKFCEVFKNKVLMYLFEDAAKQKRPSLFKGSARGSSRYSNICKAFDEQGIGIFADDIQTKAKLTDLKFNNHELDENGFPRSETESKE